MNEPPATTDPFVSLQRDADLTVLVAKYQSLVQYISYLDSYVQKVLAVFAIFGGALIANADKLIGVRDVLALGVLSTALIAFATLRRITMITKAQVTSVRYAERLLRAHSPSSGFVQTFPDFYGQGMSTSKIASYGVIVVGILAAAAPFTYAVPGSLSSPSVTTSQPGATLVAPAPPFAPVAPAGGASTRP